MRKDIGDVSDRDVGEGTSIDRTAGLKVLPRDVGFEEGTNEDTKGEIVCGGLGYEFSVNEGFNG